MIYTKLISRSEAYYKKDAFGNVVDNNGGGKQVSYNLPQEFIDGLIDANAIVPVDGSLYKRVAWMLNPEYEFYLGTGVIKLIGPQYESVDNKFLLSEGIGNTKWQLFKSMYKKSGGRGFKWFVDLYDSAIEGSELILDLDVMHRRLTMDICITGYFADMEAIIAEMNANDVLDVNQYVDKYGIAIVNVALNTLEDRMDVFEFEDRQYINIRRLKTLGIEKKHIREFCNQVYHYATKYKYFTITSLLSSGLETDLDDLGFGEVFYDSLISKDIRFYKNTFGETNVYSVKEAKFTLSDFIKEYIDKAGYVAIDIFVKELYDLYGIKTSRQGILSRIKDSKMYYDKILDYIYKDYETYYQDV